MGNRCAVTSGPMVCLSWRRTSLSQKIGESSGWSDRGRKRKSFLAAARIRPCGMHGRVRPFSARLRAHAVAPGCLGKSRRPETRWDWVRLVDGTAINTGTDRLVPARGHQSSVTAVFRCVRFAHPASRRTACRGLHLVCPGGRRSYRTECSRTLRARTRRGARPWYSPEGSAVPGGVPVPRWSWDGLVSR
jgi:hypothetical protein